MIVPYYFSNEKINLGFKINLENQNINHSNSILSIIPTYRNFGIETRYVIEI